MWHLKRIKQFIFCSGTAYVIQVTAFIIQNISVLDFSPQSIDFCLCGTYLLVLFESFYWYK